MPVSLRSRSPTSVHETFIAPMLLVDQFGSVFSRFGAGLVISGVRDAQVLFFVGSMML